MAIILHASTSECKDIKIGDRFSIVIKDKGESLLSMDLGLEFTVKSLYFYKNKPAVRIRACIVESP